MNYPSGIKSIKINNIQYGNRGMSLESDLNITNEYYIENKIAYIYKKPTPIQIVKVDYPSRKKAVIKEAYFKEPSTTDYNGLYKGKYIDFEAKETTQKSFPLSNIHSHQIKHIRNIYENNGICFIIVRFNSYNETYLLMAKDFIYFIDNIKKKTIPRSYFMEKGYKIKDNYIKRVDYLEIINRMEDII